MNYGDGALPPSDTDFLYADADGGSHPIRVNFLGNMEVTR